MRFGIAWEGNRAGDGVWHEKTDPRKQSWIREHEWKRGYVTYPTSSGVDMAGLTSSETGSTHTACVTTNSYLGRSWPATSQTYYVPDLQLPYQRSIFLP